MDNWFKVRGMVIGFLSKDQEDEELSILVVRDENSNRLYLRWMGNDLTVVNANFEDEMTIGDTVEFTTCSREQKEYAHV